MGELVIWHGVTTLDLPPDRILEQTIGKGLTGVVIMGYDADGMEFFSSSYADGGTVLWLMEKLKLKLLNVQVPG